MSRQTSPNFFTGRGGRFTDLEAERARIHETRTEPRDDSKAYLDAAFGVIEQQFLAGEIDIREAELRRTEEYDWAVEHIGVPFYPDEVIQ